MEILLNILLDPLVIVVLGIIGILGFMVSPYEISFEDKDEMEI